MALVCLWTSSVITYVALAGFDPADGAVTDNLTYTDMARGETDVAKPFRYRLVVPWLARLLPLGDLSTQSGVEYRFGLVNVVALTVAGCVLFALLRHWGRAPAVALLGVLLFYTSHTVLRFGGIPLVESAAIAVLFACYLAVVRRWRVGFVVLVLLGMLIKETTVLAVAFVLLQAWPWRDRLRFAALSLPGLVGYAWLRLVLDPTSDGYGYSATAWLHNLRLLLVPGGVSVAQWRAIVLSLGILWPLVLLALVRRSGSPRRYGGMVLATALLPLVLSTDYERVIFLSFPFALLLALPQLERLFLAPPPVTTGAP